MQAVRSQAINNYSGKQMIFDEDQVADLGIWILA